MLGTYGQGCCGCGSSGGRVVGRVVMHGYLCSGV